LVNKMGKLRPVLYYAGLMSMLISVVLLSVGERYVIKHVQLMNSGQVHESYYGDHGAAYVTVALWASVLSLVLVSFGRGWARVWALAASIFSLILVIGSI